MYVSCVGQMVSTLALQAGVPGSIPTLVDTHTHIRTTVQTKEISRNQAHAWFKN